jgi:hypothetical protein
MVRPGSDRVPVQRGGPGAPHRCDLRSNDGPHAPHIARPQAMRNRTISMHMRRSANVTGALRRSRGARLTCAMSSGHQSSHAAKTAWISWVRESGDRRGSTGMPASSPGPSPGRGRLWSPRWGASKAGRRAAESSNGNAQAHADDWVCTPASYRPAQGPPGPPQGQAAARPVASQYERARRRCPSKRS